MTMANIEVKGYKEAVAILQQMPVVMRNRMLVTSLRNAAKPMLRSAKAQAPTRSGELKKMLRIVRLRKTDSPTEVAVTLRHVFNKTKKGKENQYYAKFVHEGTKSPRTSRKRGRMLVFTDSSGNKVFRRSVKGLRPNPYLERAYASSEATTLNLFGDELSKAIEKYVNKHFKPIK